MDLVGETEIIEVASRHRGRLNRDPEPKTLLALWANEGVEVIDAQGAIEEERTPVVDTRARDFDSMTEAVECVLWEPKFAEVFESIGISP